MKFLRLVYQKYLKEYPSHQVFDMKNRHGPKGGRGSSVYRCSRRGDERVVRTGAEIAESNGGNSDDSRDDNDDDDDDDNNHKLGKQPDTNSE